RRPGPPPGLPAQHRRPRRRRAGPSPALRRGAAPLCRGPQGARRFGRPPGLLRAGRNRFGRGRGATGHLEQRHLLSAGAGGMSLADTLRRALETGHRSTPELIGGDVLDEDALAHGVTPAAVLVAVVDRPEPTVILTLRPETMRKHPGQVSFPGGRIDPGDDGP